MNILIADDEFTTRMMVQVSLENWGYDVLDACDGEEALAKYQQGEAPRIVILDWEMPGTDGLEVCQRLKEMNSEDPPYIILLTGRDSQKDILSGFDAGADDYITKPFSSNELRARIRVADRLVRTQDLLKDSVGELKTVLNQLQTLQGNFLVCGECQKVASIDDEESWHNFSELAKGDDRFVSVTCPHCEEKDK